MLPEFPPAGPDITVHELELPMAMSGWRLDQALAQALPQYSRARIQRWIQGGKVRVRGAAAPSRRGAERVRGGEQLTVAAEADPPLADHAQPLPLAIVHEDRDLLVLDKPVGLVVHPGAGNRDGTLLNALLARDPALAELPRAGIVHRLDKDTSGLMVVARTAEAFRGLTEALATHAVGREYLALVWGSPTGGARIDQPIGRHRTQRTRMTVRADGRPAVSRFRIEERLGAHTLLRVALETGRTHQIRVHLSHVGLAIVGDPLYGGRRRRLGGSASTEANAALERFRRQALHAAALALAHPRTGRTMRFEAPVPADFAALLDALRAQ